MVYVRRVVFTSPRQSVVVLLVHHNQGRFSSPLRCLPPAWRGNSPRRTFPFGTTSGVKCTTSATREKKAIGLACLLALITGNWEFNSFATRDDTQPSLDYDDFWFGMLRDYCRSGYAIAITIVSLERCLTRLAKYYQEERELGSRLP